MDDICDSVPNVECAQQLTKDLDEILDKGGFKVKELLSNEILEEIYRLKKDQVLSF
jgi:hypothetical protein